MHTRPHTSPHLPINASTHLPTSVSALLSACSSAACFASKRRRVIGTLRTAGVGAWRDTCAVLTGVRLRPWPGLWYSRRLRRWPRVAQCSTSTAKSRCRAPPPDSDQPSRRRPGSTRSDVVGVVCARPEGSDQRRSRRRSACSKLPLQRMPTHGQARRLPQLAAAVAHALVRPRQACARKRRDECGIPN